MDGEEGVRYGRPILVLVVLAAVSAVVYVAAGSARAGAAPPSLKLGSHGARVTALQKRLVELHYLPRGAVDGI